MPPNHSPRAKPREANKSGMFYGRYKIRVLSDTLRNFAEGRIDGPNEEKGGKPPAVADLSVVDIVFREVFTAPDTFVNLNPLDGEGRKYWADRSSRRCIESLSGVSRRPHRCNWSHRVERRASQPWRARMASWRFSGRWSQNFETMTWASSPAPTPLRGMGSGGRAARAICGSCPRDSHDLQA
jgi:hypothetical protein